MTGPRKAREAAGEASSRFSDPERLMLRYGDAMTRDVQVNTDLVEALGLGWASPA